MSKIENFLPGFKFFQKHVLTEDCERCGAKYVTTNRFISICDTCRTFVYSAMGTPYEKDFDKSMLAIDRGLITKSDYMKFRDKLQRKIDLYRKQQEKKLVSEIKNAIED